MDICYLDAKAVYTLFKLSGKKHLFITGERGSGKSHLLNNILNYIPYASATTDILYSPDISYQSGVSSSSSMSDFFNLSPDYLSMHSINYLQSYRTDKPNVVIRSNLIDNNKEFVIGTPSIRPGTSGSNLLSVRASNKRGNNMTIVEDGFINCAIPAINNHLLTSPDDLFVIDELGYIESSCSPFQTAVETLLDNSCVIAVIRRQSTSFLDRIKNRADVLTIDIDNIFSPLACIIMASGISKRYGSNKLLADFNSHTLFENAVNISRFADFGETLAITRHDTIKNICRREHIQCLKHDLPYRNEAIHLGVAHILEKEYIPDNIYTSVNTYNSEIAAKSQHPQGILFLPSDQPLITKTSLQLLCLSFIYGNKLRNKDNSYIIADNNNNKNNKSDRIYRLSFNETPGSPIIFPARYYNELLNLPEGRGGSFIAKKHPGQVVLVPARDEYELYDIDTADDLNRLSQYLN